MMKRVRVRPRKSKDGFIRVGTSIHERHMEAIDKIVASRDGMRRGLTKRDVLYQMISKYLNEDRDDAMDVVLGQIKLDFEREFRAVKQRQHAIIEMLAHFVRIYLGHAQTIQEDEREAFRARSKERFNRYSDEVVRMLKTKSDFFETVSGEALRRLFAESK